LTSSIRFEQALLNPPTPFFDTLPGQENILVGGNLLTVLLLPSGKIAERKNGRRPDDALRSQIRLA
jgi:hypothetical protein